MRLRVSSAIVLLASFHGYVLHVRVDFVLLRVLDDINRMFFLSFMLLLNWYDSRKE